VRPILSAYAGKDVPLEYAKTEALAKEAHLAEHAGRPGARGLGTGAFTLSSLFGAAPPPPPVPATYLEQKRAEAQALYAQEQKYIADHRAEFDRLLEEDRQAALREGAGSMFAAVQSLVGPPPEAPKPGQTAAALAAPADAGSTPVAVTGK
jgi:import inner membrane translocase subunit TIM50